jgi:hypothetical protein
VMGPPEGLYGWVYEDGQPAVGITVTLDYCREYKMPPGPPFTPYCSDQELFTAATTGEGMYRFLGMSTTSPTQTQSYQVLWENDGDPNLLRSWETQIVYSYTAGTGVNIGTFDIGNVGLISPISGTVTGFPTTFEWQLRDKSPWDSYGVCLYGGFRPPPPMNWDVVGCDEQLGYTNTRTFTDPFAGIDYGYDYYWYVKVWDPSGGVGISYGLNTAVFAAP